MSARAFGFWCLWLAGCAGAHGSAAGVPVIVAGSVCSGLPPLGAPSGVATPAQPPPLVAYFSDAPANELAVYDVQRAALRFRVKAALQSRPQILSDLVVATDAKNRLLGFDLGTGALRFSVPLQRPSWLGALQVGRLVIFTTTSLSFRPGERGSTLTAIDARSGGRVWQREVPYALSRPVVWGDRIFLISDHADVWALEARSGADAGCARLGKEPVDWLLADAAGLVIGASEARRISGAATGDETKLSLPIAQLPGRPALQGSNYDVVPAARSAHGRVALIARFAPEAGALPLLAEQRYYFVFYRDVFAYRADGALLWAQLLDSDVVRASASGSALSLLAEDGSLQQLDAQTGAERVRVRLPGHIASADLYLPSVNLPAAASAGRPLRSALSEIALDPDARLLPAREVAVAALAGLDEAAASQDLLQIYAQSSTPPALRARIAALLPARRSGTEYLVDALLESYDFLDDRSSPPLAAIVPALVSAGERRAVPRLVERLFDPDTALADLVGLVEAIAQLGDAGASEPLARFLALYHADSSLADDPRALLSAARVLSAREDPNSRALMQRIARAPSTLPALRAGLAELAPEPLPPTAAEASAPPPAATEQELPERLSDEAVQRAFAGRAEELRVCTLAELARNPSLRALRLSLVVRNDGSYTGLSVLPQRPELTACLKEKLVGLRFPAFRSGRRLTSYTIAVRPDAPSAAEFAGGERVPFWKSAEQRAGASAKIPKMPPWWQDQNPLYVSVDEAPKAVAREPHKSEPAAPHTPSKQGPPAPKPAPAAPVNEDKGPEDAWWLPVQSPGR